MRLQQVEMAGSGKTVRVHLVLHDGSADVNGQWLESAIEVPVKGIMDTEDVQRAALAHLRDLLDAEIAAMPKTELRVG